MEGFQPRQRLISRHVGPAVREALTDTPVVIVTGARQSGKSTLARSLIAEGYEASYVTLDDRATLDGARSDPDGFLSRFAGALVIDEVQRAPDLFRAIKLAVDRDRRPGRFLLTGSANVLVLPNMLHFLVGRSQVVTIWPLSQGEIEGRPEAFIDEVFSDRLPLVREDRDIRADITRRIIRGGYPEVVLRERAARRSEWFAAHVTAVLERDVREVADIQRLSEMSRLLRLLAARIMSLLNVAELSRSLAIPQTSLHRYLAYLDAAFLLQRLPAWAGSVGRRLLKSPKLVLCDTGLAAALQNVDVTRFALDPTLLGPLLESFVAMELRKQLGWSDVRAELYHFRSAFGEEVDVVLESHDGRVVGIEVKARSTIDANDFKGLRALAGLTKRKFHHGVLLYLGRVTAPFGPNLTAMPLTALWRV